MIDPAFNNVNRLFALAFPNEKDRIYFSKYYTPNIEIKCNYNVILDGETPFYDIPIKNKEETYKAITELVKYDDYVTGDSLNFKYFCGHYKLIAIDLSKQKADLENQQINFLGRLEQDATIFFITEEKHTTGLEFLQNSLKNGITKIINLLDHKDEDGPKFQTKKWHIVNDQNNGQYDKGDTNNSTIKFSTEILKSFICDYSDAYLLVTGDIAVRNGNANTKVVFKNCYPFTRSDIQLNNEYLDTCENLDLIMNMYNLIEYFDNYSGSTASLYHFNRQEQNYGNDGVIANLSDTSPSFKYKSSLLGASTQDGANRKWKNVQIIVPLKYISAFFRSCELLFINTKLL